MVEIFPVAIFRKEKKIGPRRRPMDAAMLSAEGGKKRKDCCSSPACVTGGARGVGE